jgi:hypothetical protein
MDKAVIVGIADYGSLYSVPLFGAANALAAWKTLLVDEYGFVAQGTPGGPLPNLHIVESPYATKDLILPQLDWLVDRAGPQDRLLFIFCGHGTQLNRLDPQTGTVNVEQGLVCYPSPGDTIDDATLFGEEMTARIRKPGALIMIVLDACHSAGVIDPDPLSLQPLYIDAKALGADVSDGGMLITLLQRLTAGPQPERFSMVIAAAAGELEAAYEGEVNGTRQMLFSYEAISVLNRYPSDSYSTLYSKIEPLLAAHQVPDLAGDTARHSNAFTY